MISPFYVRKTGGGIVNQSKKIANCSAVPVTALKSRTREIALRYLTKGCVLMDKLTVASETYISFDDRESGGPYGASDSCAGFTAGVTPGADRRDGTQVDRNRCYRDQSLSGGNCSEIFSGERTSKPSFVSRLVMHESEIIRNGKGIYMLSGQRRSCQMAGCFVVVRGKDSPANNIRANLRKKERIIHEAEALNLSGSIAGGQFARANCLFSVVAGNLSRGH